MNSVRLYVMISLLVIMNACSPQQNSGGGIETTNGGIVAGRILRADGSPAIHARVLARLVANPKDSILAYTNTTGNYQVKGLGKGMVSLSVLDTGSQGILLHTASNGDTSIQVDARLIALQTLRGALFCNGLPCVGVVSIVELGLSTISATDGSFSFTNVTSGSKIVHAVARGDSSLAASVVVHSDSTLLVNLSSTKQTLFDDFETSHGRNAMVLDPTEGFWYFAKDSSFDSGNSTLTPSCAIAFLGGQCYDSTTAYQNHSEHIQITFGNTMPVHFAMLGVNIWKGKDSPDTTRRWFNLQAMDSLSFYAKGSCTAAFQFITERRVQLGEGEHYQSSFTVSSAWTRYVIHASDIQIALAGEPSWNVVSVRTSGFSILMQSDCDLDLDDLVIYGLWPEEMQ